MVDIVDDATATPAAHVPRRAPGGQPRVPVIAAAAGMVVGGMAVAAFTVDAPAPDHIALTIDSFPGEVRGEVREDVGFRDAGSKAVLARLDAEFDNQLSAHRFAYGSDGAEFHYGPNGP